MCERWVGDWTNCNILTPSSFVFSSTSFSFCWAAQSGVLRAHSHLLSAGSLYSILSLTLTPTNRTSCRTGLYHCLITTCFLWASHLHPVQPVHSQAYTLISSIGCTCSLIDDWAEGQYITMPARRQDLVIISKKQKNNRRVDFAERVDHRVKIKESEENFLDVTRLFKKPWNMNRTLIPTVIGKEDERVEAESTSYRL